MRPVAKTIRQFQWDRMERECYIWEFADKEGERLAEVSAEPDTDIWTWRVLLPERYWFQGQTASGCARSEDGAKEIVRLILKQTIFFDVKDDQF